MLRPRVVPGTDMYCGGVERIAADIDVLSVVDDVVWGISYRVRRRARR